MEARPVASSQHPVIPSSHHPTIPSSHHPSIPSSHHPRRDPCPNRSAFTFHRAALCAIPDWREEQVAALIRRKLDEWGYAHNTDGAGNVVVHLAGRDPDAPLCCFAAHMDEIGMVVTSIDADGSLQVARSGGLHPWKLGEGPVEVLGDHGSIQGILSMGSTHSTTAGASAVTWADTRVITGLTPSQLAAAGIRPGSTAVPVRGVCGPIVFGDPTDPLVGAWTFDDRMGVVALLLLLEALKRGQIMPHHPTVVAFTVHEEGGGHGAKVLAQRLQPETFIAIDGCPMPPGAPLVLDSRPGIWSKDRTAHYDQRLVQALCAAARTRVPNCSPSPMRAQPAMPVWSIPAAEPTGSPALGMCAKTATATKSRASLYSTTWSKPWSSL
ncbi:MAG: M20/M25/M40 family metallo-hydrolase [Caldilineaceae bacterium]|nr:M20/M25/M40 family metallo-hydrolase [Caldilineaceae bacterium]